MVHEVWSAIAHMDRRYAKSLIAIGMIVGCIGWVALSIVDWYARGAEATMLWHEARCKVLSAEITEDHQISFIFPPDEMWWEDVFYQEGEKPVDDQEANSSSDVTTAVEDLPVSLPNLTILYITGFCALGLIGITAVVLVVNWKRKLPKWVVLTFVIVTVIGLAAACAVTVFVFLPTQ